MRFLKLTLADEKKYTLCTFTVLEQRHLQKSYRKFQDLEDDINKINFKTNEEGEFIRDKEGELIAKEFLTDEEKDKIEEIQDRQFDFMIDILRKSLCKRHPEFKKAEDPEDDKDILEKIQGLIDAPDLRKITEFAFTGVYEEDVNVYDHAYEFPE